MSIGFNTTLAMNDWFFFVSVRILTGGATYKAKFYYRAHSATYPEKLQVVRGISRVAGMTGGPIWDNNNIINTTYLADSGTFVPATSGVYYVGWHGYSNLNMYRLYVDDIEITGGGGGGGSYINPGIDKYMVSEATVGFGSDYPVLPPGFFGPGSDPFDGLIYLQGQFSEGAQNPFADISINRTGPVPLPPPPSVGTIPVEMVQLHLKALHLSG